MKTLIPELALDKHTALLGMTGSGKTSVAKSGIVEPDLEAGRRVIVIDPTSAWWGLRLSKSGKSKGYQIFIFGGDHGDYPLKAANAKLLAEAFATSSDSAIFDTSQMTVAERIAFFTEFAETFRRKNKGWVRFVIDEAHLFMPQQGAKSGGGVPSMIHAGNNLVSLGRSRGLRIVMISQRAAKLHKDSLTQASTLIAMRLMHPLDRNAVEDWVKDQAQPGEGDKVISSLSHLDDGEAWVWAPLAKMLERQQFPRPKTFDSSAAPDDDAGDGPTLAPINLDALKGKLATVEAEAKANDPKALRSEVSRLKSELTKAAKNIPQNIPDAATVRDAEATGYHRGLNEGYAKGWRAAWPDGFKSAIEFSKHKLAGDVATLEVPARLSIPDALGGPELPKAPLRIAPRTVATAAPTNVQIGNGHDSLPGPQMKIIRSLLFWASRGHATPTRAQVAGVAGYSHKGSAFTNPLGALKSGGLIRYPHPGAVQLAGAPTGAEPPDDDEARSLLLGVLSGPERKILEATKKLEAATREEVAAHAGYSADGSAFTNPLGALRSLKIIHYPQPGHVALSDWAAELLQ